MSTKPERQHFQEAIDFYKGKLQLPSSGWTDIWQQQHSHAFVVAGAAHDALVSDFYSAIQKAWQEGTGYPAFREQFDQIAAKHGWAYNGSPGWRSKVIYDTNLNTAYNAGRYKQMVALKDERPYWVYMRTTSEHPRLMHLEWVGTCLPADSAWWDTHYPPNAWGCKCRVFALTKSEAEALWQSLGKSGPDEEPIVVWQEKTVGAKGSQPRTVQVPQGIDPGFAYNPGKAWLEPHTVPPLTGYDAVLKERGVAWPAGFTPPPVPTPTVVPPSVLIPATTPPQVAVEDFLSVFGANLTQGAVFVDAAGSSVAITKAMFEDGKGSFKWITNPDKSTRLEYINLLAMTIFAPDEIWWAWEPSRNDPGRWLLKRRYLRAFEITGRKDFGIVGFSWSDDGWTSSTAFVPDRAGEANRAAYFDRQRTGRLLFKKQ